MKNLIIAILAIGLIAAILVACNLNKTKTTQTTNPDAGLATQLAALQAQNAELTEQVKQLTLTNTLRFDQKSELQIVNSTLAKQKTALQATNRVLTMQIAELKTNLDHMASQSEVYSNQLAQTQAIMTPPQPETVKAEDLPIAVSTRKAHFGKGQVLIIKDTGSQPLKVEVLCVNKTGAQKNFHLEVSPKSAKEIGWFQGWAATAGDRISIHADGYDDAHWDIN